MKSELTIFCEKLGIIAISKYGCVKIPENFKDCHPYKVRLQFRVDGKSRSLTVPFFQGKAHSHDPTPADVLHCLISDVYFGEMSFQEYCSDLGYNEDSRSAERTWKQCRKFAPRVRRFLGKHFDDVLNSEH